MREELIAFSDMYDVASTLKKELEELHPGHDFPMVLLSDSKNLFDVISKVTRTSEKRLILDIECAREGFKKGKITDIGLIRSSDNLADGLAKSMAQSKFSSVLASTKLYYIV